MDAIRSEYTSTIRPYYDSPLTEVPIRWYRCAPSAKPLGFQTAFGDSWYVNNRLFRPFLGQTRKFDPTFIGNPRGYLGVRPCGDAEAWLNGVSLLNPPAPCNCVREPVVPMQEVPAGAIDGVNRMFVTSQIPISAVSVLVFCNGVQQEQGVNYSVSGTNIYFTSSSTPTIGSDVVAYYWYLS